MSGPDALRRRNPGIGHLIAAVVLVALALVPLAGSYASGLVTEALIFAIAAMSLDILMGYAGLVSFGHAAFFGLGAYTTVVLSVRLGVPPWPAVAAGVGMASACAAVIGSLCIRLSGVGFLMLTLAFAQLFFAGAVKWRWIGGSDGIGGMAKPDILFWSLEDPAVMHYTALGAFVATFLILRHVVGSQLGHALVGLRENQARMRAMGYSVQRLKLIAFTLAGAAGGLAGTLYALFNGFVSPETLSWGTSANLLLMTVLGGSGTLVGPAIGAAIFLLMRNFVSSQTEHWMFIVGVVFIACVMFFRKGIYGTALDLAARWRRK